MFFEAQYFVFQDDLSAIVSFPKTQEKKGCRQTKFTEPD
jgi:hypothetical protein